MDSEGLYGMGFGSWPPMGVYLSLVVRQMNNAALRNWFTDSI